MRERSTAQPDWEQRGNGPGRGGGRLFILCIIHQEPAVCQTLLFPGLESESLLLISESNADCDFHLMSARRQVWLQVVNTLVLDKAVVVPIVQMEKLGAGRQGRDGGQPYGPYLGFWVQGTWACPYNTGAAQSDFRALPELCSQCWTSAECSLRVRHAQFVCASHFL